MTHTRRYWLALAAAVLTLALLAAVATSADQRAQRARPAEVTRSVG